MHLEFSRLPLVEVVCRYSLQKQLPTELPFLVDLLDALKPDFTEISDLGGIEPAPGHLQAMLVSPFVAPGARYSSSSLELEAYVQADLIGVRWLSGAEPTQISSPSEYPRFHRGLLPAIGKVRSAIEGLLGHGEVVPDVANIVYTNFIEGSQPSEGQRSSEYIKEVVPSFMANCRQHHETVYSWKGAAGVDLRIQISAGGSGSLTGYVLKTSAGLKFQEPEDAERCMILVHDEVCAMFESILTAKACEEWGKA